MHFQLQLFPEQCCPRDVDKLGQEQAEGIPNLTPDEQIKEEQQVGVDVAAGPEYRHDEKHANILLVPEKHL